MLARHVIPMRAFCRVCKTKNWLDPRTAKCTVGEQCKGGEVK